jgi:methyl-accepting chemotaxis protein
MNFQLTISRKLVAFSGLALAFVLAVGATGYFAAGSLIAATQQVLREGVGLRNQMTADQAHDALRADVLAAMELGMRYEQEKQKAIQADLATHSDLFQTAMQQLELADMDDAQRVTLRDMRPDLDQYLARATEVVSLAFTDMPAAAQKMDAFTESFHKVE